MTQLRGTVIAAFFLGIGLASYPLDPLDALISLVVLAIFAFALERWSTPLVVFCVAFLGVLFTCYMQHPPLREIYPGTGVVGFGLGALAAASMGRKWAPSVIPLIGAGVGTAAFFLL
jgi:CHASE2 domain-containing sensor protein